jgi:hypothetical protein
MSNETEITLTPEAATRLVDATAMNPTAEVVYHETGGFSIVKPGSTTVVLVEGFEAPVDVYDECIGCGGIPYCLEPNDALGRCPECAALATRPTTRAETI